MINNSPGKLTFPHVRTTRLASLCPRSCLVWPRPPPIARSCEEAGSTLRREAGLFAAQLDPPAPTMAADTAELLQLWRAAKYH